MTCFRGSRMLAGCGVTLFNNPSLQSSRQLAGSLENSRTGVPRRCTGGAVIRSTEHKEKPQYPGGRGDCKDGVPCQHHYTQVHGKGSIQRCSQTHGGPAEPLPTEPSPPTKLETAPSALHLSSNTFTYISSPCVTSKL